MKLSTRGRCATRALLDLALQQGETPILLKIYRPEAADFTTVFRAFNHPLIAGGIT